MEEHEDKIKETKLKEHHLSQVMQAIRDFDDPTQWVGPFKTTEELFKSLEEDD